MHTEFLIIGQGISGTWLSYFLHKANKSFLVIDDNNPNAASRVAAGIINPVTGRRIVKTWMIDELLGFLVPAYTELGNELGIHTITRKSLVDFHPTPQMKIAFDERVREQADFLSKPENQNEFLATFNYEFGFGQVDPCYIINLKEILSVWRKKLKVENKILEEVFNPALLLYENSEIHYKDILAEKIIFCDGISSAQSKFFSNLPFSLNKGEMLIIETNGIPSDRLYKKGMMLAPLGNDLFWIGSNYLWEFSDDQPTEQFRQQTELLLKNWLKVPFKITDHLASVRPANIERRPFVGQHPIYKNIGILNGMGTKGCSLSPYFASQLADHLVNGTPIFSEAGIGRFSKILMRQG